MAKEQAIKTKLSFDGEKEYKATCKDINSSLKVLGSEMKLVTAQYAGNEKSIEGLTAKQSVLKKQYDEQAKKVAENEKALAALKAEENQNIDAIRRFETALNNSKAELEKTKKALNGVEQEMQDATKAQKLLGDSFKEGENAVEQLEAATKKAKEELQTFSDKAKEAGEKIKTGFLAIGAAIATAFVGAVKAGDDYKDAMNGFVSQTGLGVDGAKEFETAMLNIYKGNYGEGFKDIGDAMATVAQSARDVDPKNIEKLTTNAIILRDTFDYDIQESMRAVNMLMDQFGISSDEAFNLIVQGAQKGLDKNGDLLDSINEYSVHFKQLGLNADEFFASLLNGSYSGTFSVDKLGDAVKEFGIRVKDESKGTTEAFATIGVDADKTARAFTQGGETAKQAFQEVINKLFEMDDPLAQNQAGVALFGTMWEDLGIEGVKALTDLNSEIAASNAALKQVDNIKYDSLGNAISGIGRLFVSELALPISQKLMPALNEFANELKNGESWIKPLADAVVNFVSYVISNGDKIIALLAGIGAGFAVFKMATLVTAMATAFKAQTTATTLAAAAQWALNAAWAATGIPLIIAAIAALVAGIVALWNTNEDFRNAVIGAWNAVKDACTKVWGYVSDFFTKTIPNAFNAVIDFIKNNWQGLLLLIVNPFAGAFKLLYDNCEGFKTFVNNFVENVKQFFVNGWNAIVTFFTEGIPSFVQSVIAWFEEIPSKIGYFIGVMIGNFIQFGADIVNWATTEIPKFVQTVVDFIAGMPAAIWQWLSKIATDVAQWVTNLITTAQTEIPKFIKTVVDFIAGMPMQIWNWFTKVVTDVVQWGKNLVGTAQIEIGNFVTTIVNIIAGLPQKFYDIGVNIVQGVWNGITSMASWLWDKVTDFFSSIVDGVKDTLGIESPSKVFAQIGGYMAEGLDVGFSKQMRTVEKDINNAIPTDFDVKGKVTYTTANTRADRAAQSKPTVQVTQNIYTPQYDYVSQQREAAKQFKLIARQV
jgi:phage-related minor tail protein